MHSIIWSNMQVGTARDLSAKSVSIPCWIESLERTYKNTTKCTVVSRLVDYPQLQCSHIAISPDASKLAVVLSKHRFSTYFTSAADSTDRLVIFSVPVGYVVEEHKPPLQDVWAFLAQGSKTCPVNIYYCTYVSAEVLVVAWQANCASNKAAHIISTVHITSGTWTRVFGPLMRPLLNHLSRAPCVVYANPNVYMLCHDSPWDLSRVQLRVVPLQEAKTFDVSEQTLGPPVVFYLTQMEHVLDMLHLRMAIYEDCLYMLGAFHVIHVYNLKTLSLSFEPILPDAQSQLGYPESLDPKIRHNYGFAQDENAPFVYIGGGYSLSYNDYFTERKMLRNDMWRLDLRTLQWTQIQMRLPLRMAFSTLAISETHGLLFAAATQLEAGVVTRRGPPVPTFRNENRLFRIVLQLPSLQMLAWDAALTAHPRLAWLPKEALRRAGLLPKEYRDRLHDFPASMQRFAQLASADEVRIDMVDDFVMDSARKAICFGPSTHRFGTTLRRVMRRLELTAN